MKITILQYCIWYSAPLLQLVIVLAMIRRKLANEVPVFFVYTAFHLGQFAVTYVAHLHSYKAYFYSYWVTEILDALITLAVIQEIFGKVFEPYKTLRRVEMWSFYCGAILLCSVSVVFSMLDPSTYSDRIVRGLIIVQRSTDFLQAGLMLLLFLCSALFGLGWRHYIFGISLGYGVSAATGLVIATLRAQLGPGVENIFAPLLSGSVLIGIVIWTYYFTSSKSVMTLQQLPSSGHLRHWNEALLSFSRQNFADLFLPRTDRWDETAE